MFTKPETKDLRITSSVELLGNQGGEKVMGVDYGDSCFLVSVSVCVSVHLFQQKVRCFYMALLRIISTNRDKAE